MSSKNTLAGILFVLSVVYCFSEASGQTIRNYTVEIGCTTRTLNSTQSELTLRWVSRSPAATAQYLYRKTQDAYTWGSQTYRVLASTDSIAKDTIPTGTVMEYLLQKNNGPHGFSIFGYVLAGHRKPYTLDRGKIVLIIDSLHKDYLSSELRTFRNDLIGDGWTPLVHYVDSTTSPVAVKRLIAADYYADPANVKSVFLIGRVAVPYSGDFKSSGEFPPDGHTTFSGPSHEGAWPADVYYGDMDTLSWTDTLVTNTLGARSANNNTIGDGKFDQTYLPTLVELQVGRVDMHNMPIFSASEQDLLKQYLQRDHNFRHKVFSVRERGLIDDNFGVVSGVEDFANNGFRNNAATIGSNVTVSNLTNSAIDYLSTLDTSDYLWSYACGSGSYISASGVITTYTAADTNQEFRSVFTGMFGSYFGDWDNSNNLLRAMLAAKGYILNNVWAGRPHWFFHHMAMGEPIGYSALRTQNNYDTMFASALYPNLQASILDVHVALMGDPSVRMQPVIPPTSFIASQTSCRNTVTLNWTASTDTAVNEYLILRASNIDSTFTYIGSSTGTSYTDMSPLDGINVYMLRGNKLQTSASGTYFNLSQGVYDTATFDSIYLAANAGTDTAVCPGSSVIVGVKVNSNPSYVKYAWSPGGAITDTTTVTINSTSAYVLSATDTTISCTITDTVQITMNPVPAAETISSSKNPFYFCNNPVNWRSTALNGNGFTYAWTFQEGDPASISGNGLNEFTDISYDTLGYWTANLTITNNTTGCSRSDTAGVLVACSPLPVDMLYFDCENAINNNTEIRWQTAREVNNNYFRLEQRLGNHDYTTLAEIPSKAVNGNSYVPINYTYTVPYTREAGEMHYRLWQIDLNGKETLLEQCQQTRDSFKINNISAIPNPFTNNITVQVNDTWLPSTISLYNGVGELVLQQPCTAQRTELNTTDLPTGIYLLVVSRPGYAQTLKLVRTQ